MTASDAAEGPSIEELLRQVDAGEISVNEAAELLDATISESDDAGRSDPHTPLDALFDRVEASVVENLGIVRAVEALRAIDGFGEITRTATPTPGILRAVEALRATTRPSEISRTATTPRILQTLKALRATAMLGETTRTAALTPRILPAIEALRATARLSKMTGTVMPPPEIGRTIKALRATAMLGRIKGTPTPEIGPTIKALRATAMLADLLGTATQPPEIARIARELAQLGRRGRRRAASLLEAVADRVEARRPGSRLPWWLRLIAAFARRNRSKWPPLRQARAGSRPRPDYRTAQPPPGRCVASSPRKVRGPNPRTDVSVHPRVAAA